MTFLPTGFTPASLKYFFGVVIHFWNLMRLESLKKENPANFTIGRGNE